MDEVLDDVEEAADEVGHDEALGELGSRACGVGVFWAGARRPPPAWGRGGVAAFGRVTRWRKE